ncbi:hypothetical protein BPO_1134 [Bergeyella porcorum]|uniref:Uncharacterized protein n=1 Tax=Bergeyella porcorum TaxID=1735111 RepID=A0AAU0F147_9FLAO
MAVGVETLSFDFLYINRKVNGLVDNYL